MKAQMNRVAVLALQWSLGVVIFIEAALLAFSRTEVRFPGQPAIHHWSRIVLAWSEMLRGNFQIGGLLIYAAAVTVVASWTHWETASSEQQS